MKFHYFLNGVSRNWFQSSYFLLLLPTHLLSNHYSYSTCINYSHLLFLLVHFHFTVVISFNEIKLHWWFCEFFTSLLLSQLALFLFILSCFLLLSLMLLWIKLSEIGVNDYLSRCLQYVLAFPFMNAKWGEKFNGMCVCE